MPPQAPRLLACAALLCVLWAAPKSLFANLAAFADVHGAYAELTSLLREQNIIDEAGRWRAGTLELVSLGDLIDRGAEGRQVLDLLMRLQTEAAAAGGRMHLVLGNHEIMNLTGELDYVSKADFAQFAADETAAMRDRAFGRMRAAGRWSDIDGDAARQQFEERFAPGFFARLAAFSPAGRYGAWLLNQTIVLQRGDTLFVHGGLPPVLARAPADEVSARLLTEVRNYALAWHEALEAGLVDPDTPFREHAALAGTRAASEPHRRVARTLSTLERSAAFTPDGPAWYRGQALCHPAYEDDVLTAALARQRAKRVVVGHTVSDSRRVLSRFEGRVLLADTGMLNAVYKGRGSIVYLDGASVRVAYAGEGAAVGPVDDPVSVGRRPGALDDSELARVLSTGPISQAEDTGDGRERIEVAIRAGLSVQAAAIPQASSGVWRGDRELAAYQLDRLLDLRLVPVTVERAVQGRDGSIQFLPKGVVSHAERQARGDNSQGWCPLRPQYDLMTTFDALMGLGPRDPRWIGYTGNDPMLILTGHGEAFATSSRLPAHLRNVRFNVSRVLRSRLQVLTAEAVQAGLPSLSKRQVTALLKRRDALLERSAALDVSNDK